AAEIEIRLGAVEAIGRDADRPAVGRRMRAGRCEDQRECGEERLRQKTAWWVARWTFSAQYLLIEAGAPHSSAVTQEAQSVLDAISRTWRSQRAQVFCRLWPRTSSKNACSSCPSMSQKPK